MTFEELKKWFEDTTKDEFFNQSVEIVTENFSKLKNEKMPLILMLWVPDEDRYIYLQADERTSGITPESVVAYCRKNKTIVSELKPSIKG